MHVCVCTCTRVLQCACATICALFLAGAYNCTRPSQGHGHRHGHNRTHTQPLRNIQAHRHKEGRHNHTLKHRYTKAQAHTHLPLHTHTLLSTFSLAQIMHTFIHVPHSQPHSFTPGNMPSVSLSLLIYTQGRKIHHAHNRSHLRKFPQPAIHPSATPEGFPTPVTHSERHKTKCVSSIRPHTQRQEPHVSCSLLYPQMPGTVPGIL